MLQTIIHRLEEGGGLRLLKYWLLVPVVLVLVAGYNLRGFKNMSNPEAMDTAQLARNIAEHKGYNTLFVRPFSMYLVDKTYADKHGPAPIGDLTDRSRIKDSMHPDLANPPVYPFLLAGMMKLGDGFRYAAAGATTLDLGKKHIHIWDRSGSFWIYPPDFWISLFNQVLFLLMVVALFFLTRRLFDSTVAWTSAALFLATDLFWRFSISGLSTILLMWMFVGLAWCLSLMDQAGRAEAEKPLRLNLLAVGVGALIGFGCLTRYSFGWLIIPAIAFMFMFAGRHRVVLCLISIVVFFAVISPWVVRNYRVSHTLFGTAGYSIYELTSFFPENRLMRSLHPDLAHMRADQVWYKFVGGMQTIFQDDLPRLGGSWISAFFLVGLLIPFRNQTLGRLRYFLLLCLPVLIVVQALGRTHLSDESPVVNSENLLVLLAPLVIIFGVSFFFTLLDQINLPIPELRYFVIGVFCVLICLPTFLNFIRPRVAAVAYPPYHPPTIQRTAAWMKPDELMMSDVPWAVAWYGKRQCIWLTLNAQSDFFDIYDYKKRVSAVYLTPVTMDSKFLSQWTRVGQFSWGSFVADTLLKRELPQYFPLKKAPGGFLPEQLFLSDTTRWTEPAAVAANPPAVN